MPLLPDLDTIKYLQQLAPLAEEEKALLPEQLSIIYEQKWFKLFVPKEYGGLEAGLIEGLQLEEALAKTDGSLGWTVTLCSGACMFAGFIKNAVAREIFADGKVCFAGSGHASGIARITEDGYIINGSWDYATGAPHATVFTANCKIEKEGQLLLNQDGEAEVLSFFFFREEVGVHNNWDSMGLKATAGYSFDVKDLQVSGERTFIIDAQHATISHPLYYYPFLQFAEATIAVNTLGMALHFLDESYTIFQAINVNAKQQAAILREWKESARILMALKERFYSAVKRSWEEQLLHNSIKEPLLLQVSQASRDMVKKARDMVAHLYPYCGLSQTKPVSTINRIFRDIFTASQHRLLNLPEDDMAQ